MHTYGRTLRLLDQRAELVKRALSVRFGIGASIRIGQKIQCLPYAGFFGIGATIRTL